MTDKRTQSIPELIILVALLTAIVAMCIDSMLPALDVIAHDFGVTNPNHRQFVITLFFAGLTCGTLVYGPVSDAMGRKPVIYFGLALFVAGTIVCILASSFSMFLVGRVLQGLGAAAPRVVSIAMVRDGMAGASMARVLSFVTTVFMLVPILAPSFGQLILLVSTWRVIFITFLVMAAIATAMLFFFQPETLPQERRKALSIHNMYEASLEFFKEPVALSYTLASGFIFGGLITYLTTSQQIFIEIYNQGKLFPVWFGAFAISVAMATQFNARYVVKLGMLSIARTALWVCCGLACVYTLAVWLNAGIPPLWITACFIFSTLFCCGCMFGNFMALALEPLGRIAGMASTLNSTLSTLIAIIFGAWFGQLYDGTLSSLALAFLLSSALALMAAQFARWRHKVRKSMP